MKITKVFMRDFGKDEYGVRNCVWITQKQADYITSLRANPDTRHSFIRVGRYTFAPADISYMEEVSCAYYDLPLYTKDRIKKEDEEASALTKGDN